MMKFLVRRQRSTLCRYCGVRLGGRLGEGLAEEGRRLFAAPAGLPNTEANERLIVFVGATIRRELARLLLRYARKSVFPRITRRILQVDAEPLRR